MGTIAKLSIVKGEQFEGESKHLHRIFEEKLLGYSDKNAVIYNGPVQSASNSSSCTLSYQQLNKLANSRARILASDRRVSANQDGDYIVAVCMKPTEQLVITLLSIWKAGAAYLPIDPSFPPNRIQHILQEAKPIAVIYDDHLEAKTVQQFGATKRFSVSELMQQQKLLKDTNLTPAEMLGTSTNSDLAIVMYTSGSTGVPKGVRLPHKVLLNRLQWQWNTFPYAEQETVGVFKTALTFVDSVSELWGPLLNGLSIVVVPKCVTSNPERLVKLLDEYKIRRLVLVPSLLRSLLLYLNLEGGNRRSSGSKQLPLYNLHIWVCSGEPLALSLAKEFFDYFQEGIHTLYNFYGSTEVMGDVTYFSCSKKKQLEALERVPIGLPISNTVIYLLDSDYRPVRNGEIGEIYVAGANLASGYVNNRDPDKFIDNPLAIEQKYSRLYRTGDYGSISENGGHIYYEGRTDSQIKVRGHRVDLSEVEKNLSALPAVEKGVVLCYHAGEVDQALLAFVKLNAISSSISEMQLEAQLQDRLANYMMPQVILVDEIPLLVNGKVDRQALLRRYETANNNDGDTSIVLDYDYTDVSRSEMKIAKDLFETVGSVIGRSTRATLSLKSNFYELGGNSLNSIYTVSLLREKGYNISISKFIVAKNLAEVLEQMIRNNNNNNNNDNNNNNSMENTDNNEWESICPHLDMYAIPLQHEHKNDVIQIIIDSFYDKADLEQWLKPEIYRTDYSDLLNSIWSDLVAKDLSFVVYDRNTNRIIGASLNFDARNEPEVEVTSKLLIVFEFLEFLEGPIRENELPAGLNKIFHAFMMGTHVDLNAQENIACMQFMEHEVLRLARKKSFAGILTTNTSPLTQQLGNSVYKYKTMREYQINKYIFTDGTYPFAKAPDSQRVIVHWKEL